MVILKPGSAVLGDSGFVVGFPLLNLFWVFGWSFFDRWLPSRSGGRILRDSRRFLRIITCWGLPILFGRVLGAADLKGNCAAGRQQVRQKNDKR